MAAKSQSSKPRKLTLSAYPDISFETLDQLTDSVGRLVKWSNATKTRLEETESALEDHEDDELIFALKGIKTAVEDLEEAESEIGRLRGDLDGKLDQVKRALAKKLGLQARAGAVARPRAAGNGKTRTRTGKEGIQAIRSHVLGVASNGGPFKKSEFVKSLNAAGIAFSEASLSQTVLKGLVESGQLKMQGEKGGSRYEITAAGRKQVE
jgi:hypothetical protein